MQSDLLNTLHNASKPKHILQSLAFITSNMTQSLNKSLAATSIPFTPRSSTEKLDTEVALLPIKQSLIDTSEKLISLQTVIAHIPKREYSTIEARARALRTARSEAIDRLEDIISSTEANPVPEDWDDDVRAANELIVFLPQHPPTVQWLITRGAGPTNLADKDAN